MILNVRKILISRFVLPGPAKLIEARGSENGPGHRRIGRRIEVRLPVQAAAALCGHVRH